jgi:hypothetical protein
VDVSKEIPFLLTNAPESPVGAYSRPARIPPAKFAQLLHKSGLDFQFAHFLHKPDICTDFAQDLLP